MLPATLPAPALRPAGPCRLRPAFPPTVGPVRRRLRLRGSLAYHLAVPEPCCRFSGRLPLRDAFPVFVLGLRPSCRSSISDAVVRSTATGPNDCAPLAASAVRRADSEEPAGRVFRYCCGHRCRYRKFKLSYNLSGYYTGKTGSVFALDKQKLRLMTESRKRNLRHLSTARRKCGGQGCGIWSRGRILRATDHRAPLPTRPEPIRAGPAGVGAGR